MKTAVIFQGKKFIVVVSDDSTVRDLKTEIARVYSALFPTNCLLPASFELQTLAGCMLYDGYSVSSVLSDNDIVSALTESPTIEATPHSMPPVHSESPWFWPYYGISPMGPYSPMLATHAMNRSLATPPQYLHTTRTPPASSYPYDGTPAMNTPAMRLFQSPVSSSASRTIAVQCPSPKRRGSRNDSPPLSPLSPHQSSRGKGTSSTSVQTDSPGRERIGSLLEQLDGSQSEHHPAEELELSVPVVSQAHSNRGSSDGSQPSRFTLATTTKQRSAGVKNKKRTPVPGKNPQSGKDTGRREIAPVRESVGKVSTASDSCGSEARNASSRAPTKKSKVSGKTSTPKSSDVDSPAAEGMASPSTISSRRQSQHIAPISALLKMKEIVDNPLGGNSYVTIPRKRKLSESEREGSKPDAKKPKSAKRVKTVAPKQHSDVKRVSLAEEDSSDWTTSDSEMEAGKHVDTKSSSITRKKTGSSKALKLTKKLKSRTAKKAISTPANDSSSDWESDGETENAPTQASTVTAKVPPDQRQTSTKAHVRQNSESSSKEPLSDPKAEVDSSRTSLPIHSHGRSKKELENKAPEPTEENSSTEQSFCSPREGGKRESSPTHTIPDSSGKRESRGKKSTPVAMIKGPSNLGSSSSSEWSSDEESEDGQAAQSQVTDECSLPQQKETDTGKKVSTARLILKPSPRQTNSEASQQQIRDNVEEDEKEDVTEDEGNERLSEERTADKDKLNDEGVNNNGERCTDTDEEDANSAKSDQAEEEGHESDHQVAQTNSTLKSSTQGKNRPSPVKGVFSSQDRKMLKQRQDPESNTKGSTKVVPKKNAKLNCVKEDGASSTDEVECSEVGAGRVVESDGVGMYEEVIKSNSSNENDDSLVLLEVLAPDSIPSDEEVVALASQSHEDGVTVIQETQETREYSRSASPEIPYLGQTHTAAVPGHPRSHTPKQKILSDVTLHSNSAAFPQKRDLQSSNFEAKDARIDPGRKPAQRGAGSLRGAGNDNPTPTKLKKLKSKKPKDIGTKDLLAISGETSDATMSTVSSGTCEESVASSRRKKHRVKLHLSKRSDMTPTSSPAHHTAASDSSKSKSDKSGRKRKKKAVGKDVRGHKEGEESCSTECDTTVIPSSEHDVSEEEMDCEANSSTSGRLDAAASQQQVQPEIPKPQSSSKSGGLSIAQNTIEEDSDTGHLEREVDQSNTSQSLSESEPSKKKKKHKHRKSRQKNRSDDGVQTDETFSESSSAPVSQTATIQLDVGASSMEAVEAVEEESGNEVSKETAEEENKKKATVVSTENDDAVKRHSQSSDSSKGNKSSRKKKKRKKNREEPQSTATDQQSASEEPTPTTASGSDSTASQASQQKVLKQRTKKTGKGECDVATGDIVSAPEKNLSTSSSASVGRESSNDAAMLSQTAETKTETSFLKPRTTPASFKALKSSVSPAQEGSSKSGGRSHNACNPSTLQGETRVKPSSILSSFSVTETEHSSDESSCERDSSAGKSRLRHVKKPHKLNFLSSLGSHGKKPKPARLRVPFSRNTLATSSSQRRFSSETASRMFSLSHSPHSIAAKRAKKLYSTPPLPPKLSSPSKKKKRQNDVCPSLDNLLTDKAVMVGEEDGGKEPSLSELLADGHLWEN